MTGKRGWIRSLRIVASLPAAARRRWIMQIPVALLAAALEALTAASVVWMITALDDPGVVRTTPLLGGIFDTLAGNRDSLLVVAALAVVGTLYAAKNALLTWTTVASSRLIAHASSVLARRLLSHLLAKPYVELAARDPSESIRDLTLSVGAAGGMLSALLSLLTNGLLGVALVAVLLAASPLVTLVTGACLTILVAVGLRLTGSLFEQWGSRSRDVHADILETLRETFDGVRELKLRGCEPFFIERFAARRQELARLEYLNASWSVIPRLAVETLFVGGGLLAIGLLAAKDGSSSISVPLIGLYAYAGFRLLPLTNGVLWQVNGIRYAMSVLGDASEAIGDLSGQARCGHVHDPNHSSGRGARTSPSERVRESIALDDVAFRYPGAASPVLDGVRLRIDAGETLGIAGETGSGKTTLVEIISGLLEPDAGAVRRDGEDVRGRRGQRTLSSWRHGIGYVPQEGFVLNDSVVANIAFAVAPDDVDDERLGHAIEASGLLPLLSALPDGRDTVLGDRGHRLSGGQRQRIGIARALYARPCVLILDEALSALDPRAESELLTRLRGLDDISVRVVVSHRESTLRACDRIAYLDGGFIQATGDYRGLRESNPAFRALSQATDPGKGG